MHLNRNFEKGGYLIFDDTVLDKRHSRKIEMVRRQYSGNIGGVIKGIACVNMLYYEPRSGKIHLLGYRLFDPDFDQKSKLDHVVDLLSEAEAWCIPYVAVLMDTWYAVNKLFQLIACYGKVFYCPVKSNRLAQVQGDSKWRPLKKISWSESELKTGKSLKLRKLEAEVKAYHVIVSTNKTAFILTNASSIMTINDIKAIQKYRWKIEEFHRELKQVTGIEKCQCRTANSQRTHIFCAMLVWNKLKELAYQTYETIYNIKFKPINEAIKIILAQTLHTFA